MTEDNVSKCIKIGKTWNYTMRYVFRPFTQFLAEATLAANAALIVPCRSSPSGWMGTGSGRRPFSGLPRDVPLGWSQSSGLATQCHSLELFLSQSCVFLSECSGSLSRWKVSLRPRLRSRAHWTRFLSGISLFLFTPLPPCFTVGLVLGR